MSVLDSRISRRTLGGVAMGVAATSGLAYLVSAQDATPAPGEGEATPMAAPTLAELESAGHISVTANNGSYSVRIGGGLEEGWYVVTLDNASDADANVNLAMLPEGTGVGDLTTFLFDMTSGALTELPAWYGESTFAGGTYAPVGGSNSALVKLTPGEWVLFSSKTASKQSPTTIKVLTSDELMNSYGVEAAATPEGGSVAPEGFTSSFTVSVSDAGIMADAAPAAGLNTLGVRNDGSAPADLVILHSPTALEGAAGADLAKAWAAGETVDAHLIGGMGALSPNAYGYVELTGEAGTYVVFSSLPNATGGSQVDDGVIMVANLG